MQRNKVLDGLIGLAVGDALGVPVEFQSRDTLENSPVTDMVGYGTHNQPPGTWSDDSSLAFCLAESLCQGYDLNAIAKNFVRWHQEGHWTPHGTVFDIGNATAAALRRVATGVSPLESGGKSESDNGNGSLMRILPLIYYIKDLPIQARYRVVADVSGITHGHIRSIFACFIYCEFALELLQGWEKKRAYGTMQVRVRAFAETSQCIPADELARFHRLLNPLLWMCPESEIASSGYVIHTLEAGLWCFLTRGTFAGAVLRAVNLGGDTDTTGCVAGGLAGLYYGYKAIQPAWVASLAKKEAIFDLSYKLHQTYSTGH